MSDIDPERNLDEVRDFVFRYIDSFEMVRVLLLLHDNPTKQWTIEELSSELRSSSLGIEKRLRDLYDRKVLRKPAIKSKHSYIPYDPEISKKLETLSEYSKRFPHRLIDLIYSRPDEALREFSNAFSFKKDKSK